MKSFIKIFFLLILNLNLFAVTITSPDTFSVNEGILIVGTAVSDDKDADFSIVGGDDQALFSITTDGEIKFISTIHPTDFEHPDDDNKDNIYHIVIQSEKNATQTTTQDVTIIVEDVDTDLTLTNTASKDPLIVGDNFEYTLQVTNNGPDSAKDVKIINALPAGVVFNSAIGNDWYCVVNSGEVRCDYDLTLLSGSSSSDVNISVTAPGTDGNITNYAEVSSSSNIDYTPANNIVQTNTQVLSNATDLSIAITANPSPNVSTTDTITYTITVENLGENTASDVRVEDILPSDLGFISITDGNNGNTWSCSTSNWVICDYVANGGDLEVGSGGSITIVTRAPNTVMTIENNASVSHGSIDSNGTNNSASNSVNVINGASSTGAEPFTKYLQYNIFGDMKTISGANLNGVSNQNYNDNVNMQYQNRIDDNRYNSSSDTLTLEEEDEVLWAGLYWQGTAKIRDVYNRGRWRTDNSACNWNDSLYQSSGYNGATQDLGKVLFRVPGGNYTSLTANRLNAVETIGSSSYSPRITSTVYGAFADVTAQVRAAGAGDYSVRNIVSCEGSISGGNYAGWNMLVIYQNPTATFRNISVFNGFVAINTPGTPTRVDISGFVTPNSGTVNSKIAYFGADGDRADGGSAKATNVSTNIYENLNGDSNLLNSRNNLFTGGVGPVTYGVDSDEIDVSNYLTNGDTSVSFFFDAGTNAVQDHYTLNMFAFSTDMFTPIIDGMQKTATVGGMAVGPGTVLSPGDTITYDIYFENSGTGETATEVEIFDDFDYDDLYNIFDFTTAPTVTLTPNASDAECGYDAIEHKVWCKLDSVADGEAYNMSFSLTIRDDFSGADTNVTNTAYSRYKNETTGDPVIRVDNTNGKFGGTSNTNNAGTIEQPTEPGYQNDYTCGVFSNVLTSYESITSNANNDQACYTDTISYPAGQLFGDIECNPSGCGGGTSCTRVDPPSNRYSHNFPTNSKEGQVEIAPPSTLTALEYGNISYSGGSVHFAPEETYYNSTTKVMLLGDATFSQTLISFEPGDYYFDSFNITKNQNNGANFDLPSGGVVRIFIKGNLSLELNNLFMNTGGSKDGSAGDPNDLFIYVNGNFTTPGSDGGNTMMKAFIYTEGEVTLNNKAANWEIWGGITAEGPISIERGNPKFNQIGNADDFGLGDCIMCYAPPQGPNGINFFGMSCSPTSQCNQYIPVRNLDDVPLDDVKVIELQRTNSSLDWGKNWSVVDKDENTVLGSSALKNDAYYMNLPTDFSLGIENGSVTYNVGDNYPTYDPNQDYYQLYKRTDQSMSIAQYDELLYLASYTDSQGRHYNLQLDSCEDPANPPQPYITGPFDAWDTAHDNVVYPPNDRNISTKVINKPFSLSLASLNRTNDGYETKKGVGSSIEVGLYSSDAPTVLISNTVPFDANSTSHVHESAEFTATKATQNAMVAFKVCSTFEDNVYTLYSSANCSTTADACDEETTTPKFHICPATDPFAIRPDRFDISAPTYTNADIELLTASKDENLTLVAAQYGSTDSSYDYNITGAKSVLTISKIIYETDNSVSSTLDGDLKFAVADFNIEDGQAVNGAGVNFSDVGKVNIKIIDTTWSNIDSVDPLSPDNCTETGRYICGEINATFIPDRFTFSNTSLFNSNNDNFTYLSNDLNESARIGFTLTAQGATGQPTKNFTQGSWENPVDINYSVVQLNGDDAIKDEIDTSVNLGFTNGVLTVNQTETNDTKILRFNYPRVLNVAVNPVMIDGTTEVDIEAKSTYTSSSGTPRDIKGTRVVDDNVTFVYGRTNAPRQRFMAPVGATIANPAVDLIYFEVYCNNCNRTLLPNGNDSNITNDPRWFINANHTSIIHGEVLDINQKITGIDKYVTATNGTIIGNGVSTTNLVYDGTRDYPYKATMENNASSWLIYNKYDAGADRNEFEVEFDGGSGSWAGKKEDNPSTTQNNAADTTNRRSMW